LDIVSFDGADVVLAVEFKLLGKTGGVLDGAFVLMNEFAGIGALPVPIAFALVTSDCETCGPTPV
jgi:hypothetical protein